MARFGKRDDEDAEPMTPAEAAKNVLVAMTPEQIAELLKAVKSDDDDLLKKKADYDAAAMKRVMKPENEFHPGISVFNPQGERDHPKAPLRCPTFWVGYDLRADNLTPEEVRLVNALADRVAVTGFPDVDDQGKQCALFACTRTDGASLQVRVYGLRENGHTSKLEVMFPCRGEHKYNLPTMANLLRQMLGELDPEKAEALAEIARLRQELAALGR